MKNKKRLKRLLIVTTMFGLLLVLSGCGTGEITSHSTGIWDRYIVYNFARCISFLSFGDNHAIGIILFTILIRIILLPLMHYQNKQMIKTQELQPKLQALQKQYSSKDQEIRLKLQEETQKLYAEEGVNPFSGCLPLLIQMPVLMALYQALARVPELTSGKFLWMDLSKSDPWFILPILAALFTFISSKLMTLTQAEVNPTTKTMNYFMPIMILVMAINLASGLSLYWVVSNAFQVGQTLLLNKPFTRKREMEEKKRKERKLQKELYKAQHPHAAKKKKKKRKK